MRRRALLAAGVALAARPVHADPSVPEPDGYRLDDYRAPVPDTVRGAQVLHLAAMRELVEKRDALLIDVLPAPRRPPDMRPGSPWLPPPHRSLPGALWWPDVGRGEISPALEAAFRERLTAEAGEKMAVFFCLNDCWMSWNATKRAASFGVRAAWFPEGADGWEAAGLPVSVVQPETLG